MAETDEYAVERRKLTIPVAAPFKLAFTVWALRRRESNIVDLWDEDTGTYTRILVLGNQPVKMIVVQEGTADDPNLILTLLSPQKIDAAVQKEILLIVRKMLGLADDLQPFYKLAAANELLAGLVKDFSGVRPPCFPDIFEALINAISCQQLTLDTGILMTSRLAERFGVKFDTGGTLQYAFPRPEDLKDAAFADIKDLGYSSQKSLAIKELTQTFLQRDPDLARLDQMDNEQVIRYLKTLRGIGRWSAEYVLLRGLGRLDVFPGDDAGARDNLQRLFHLAQKPDYEEIKRLTSLWHPYEGLVYFHLLLEKLRGRGVI